MKKNWRLFLCLGLNILLVGLLIGCGSTEVANDTEPPETLPAEEPTPAEFILSNLQVEIGEREQDSSAYSCIVSVDVQNIGGSSGIYEFIFRVDNEDRDICRVELNPSEKETATAIQAETRIRYLRLLYERGEENIGAIHTISVDGLSQTITFPEPSPPAYALQLLSSSSERAYSYITMSGEVKNISDSRLENVLAVVSYYTEDDTFVKSADALIDYNPILSGQTSPFEVITTDNPAITGFRISFKYLFGGTISYEDKR